MPKINRLVIGGELFTNCNVAGKDVMLLNMALGITSKLHLYRELAQLVVRNEQDRHALLGKICVEVKRLMQKEEPYFDVIKDMKLKGFDLGLVAKVVTIKVGYNYRSIGRAVKLVLLYYGLEASERE